VHALKINLVFNPYFDDLFLTYCLNSATMSSNLFPRFMLEEEELPFLTHCNPFMSSTCRRHKPQKAKANQNKPTQNAIAPLLLLQTI
jgi:hypothetical protein